MSCDSCQAASTSAAASQLQFTMLAKQLNVVKQQGQQMVEMLEAVSKSIDSGVNFDGQA